jgi:hypothetical protein
MSYRADISLMKKGQRKLKLALSRFGEAERAVVELS